MKPKRIPPKKLDTMLKWKMSDAFVEEDELQRRREKRRSHKKTPRLTARERARAFLSTIGICGGAREDRLTVAFSAHGGATLARHKRREGR